jgi:hypothetical protein
MPGYGSSRSADSSIAPGGRSREPWSQHVTWLRVLRSLRQALEEYLPGMEWGELPVVGLEWEEWEGHGGVVFYPVATPSSGQLDHDDLSTIAGLQMRPGAAFREWYDV